MTADIPSQTSFLGTDQSFRRKTIVRASIYNTLFSESAIMDFYTLDPVPHVVPSSPIRHLELPADMFSYGPDDQATCFGYYSNTVALNVPEQVESIRKFSTLKIDKSQVTKYTLRLLEGCSLGYGHRT